MKARILFATMRLMITVIHGDNLLQIRKMVEDQKKRYHNAEIITLVKPDLAALRQNLSTMTMFSDSRLTIIESLLQKGLAQEGLDFLASLDNSSACIFVEYLRLDRLAIGKEKKKTLLKGKKLLDGLKLIKGLTIIPCNDYSLFDFFDSIKPGNRNDVIVRFDALLQADYEAEAIFYMLVDHVKNLVIAADIGSSGLSSIHEFRAKKIVQQARSFSLPKLISFYQSLYNVEVAQKEKRLGSGSPFSMAEDLRFLLSQVM